MSECAVSGDASVRNVGGLVNARMGVSGQRSDFGSIFGDWDQVAIDAIAVSPPGATTASATTGRGQPVRGALERMSGELRDGLAIARQDPAALLDPVNEPAALALFAADGDALDALAGVADHLRSIAVGEDVTYVMNWSVDYSNICYTGCRFCSFGRSERDPDGYRLSPAEVAERAAEAWRLGATEVCLQGGIDPRLPADAPLEIVRLIKELAPGVHVDAFSPMEIAAGARRAGVSTRDWLIRLRDAGLDSIPGTAAEILDDDVRRVLTRSKLSTAEWIDVVTIAHELGIRSSATMMFGHVDQPSHWLTHMRILAAIQDRTGGFTEFVPLPFIHHRAPIYRAGISRPGATWRENRAIHAMARVLLHGRISDIQCSWAKLGDSGSIVSLEGGANDLGGTLMNETVSHIAGWADGAGGSAERLHAIAAAAGRPARERPTRYRVV